MFGPVTGKSTGNVLRDLIVRNKAYRQQGMSLDGLVAKLRTSTCLVAILWHAKTLSCRHYGQTRELP